VDININEAHQSQNVWSLEDKTKKKVLSHENFRTKERNIVAVKAKMNQPQFIYNRTYVNMQPGKCVEYNLNDDTSLLTRDDRFLDFMDRPYAVIPTTANHKGDQRAYLLISPKWTGFRAGWLESQTETYNIFRIDRYAAWSGLVPDYLKEDLDLTPRYSSIKILQNDDYLVGDDLELENAWERYRDFLLRKEKNIGIRIKSTTSARFNLASKLVADGVIPWISRTVIQSWKWSSDISLRPYQQEAMGFFIEHGTMTLVYPFGAGKTLFGVQAISCISDRTLVVVPSVSHIAVWQKYIEDHLLKYNNNAKPRIALFYGGSRKEGFKYADIIVSTYESALTYLTNERFKLLIFDECHHFPANTYSRC
jgi:hypothetical protein